MSKRFKSEGAVRALAMVATIGVATTAAASAEARWRGAASCLKAIAERTRSSGDEFAWALSCTPDGFGNYFIVHSHRSTGDGSWSWPADPQRGAGHSIALRDGIPFVLTADSNVWWKSPPSGGDATTGGTWIRYPNNLCEGGTLRLSLPEGNPTVAVGDGFAIYVVDFDDQVKTWNGSCWTSLPKFSFRRVREIAIWGGDPSGQRTRPWVVLDNGLFWRLEPGNFWRQVPNAQGQGVAQSGIIGSDGASRWNLQFSTGLFTQDTTWPPTGAGVVTISQITDSWTIASNGKVYHLE